MYFEDFTWMSLQSAEKVETPPPPDVWKGLSPTRCSLQIEQGREVEAADKFSRRFQA